MSTTANELINNSTHLIATTASAIVLDSLSNQTEALNITDGTTQNNEEISEKREQFMLIYASLMAICVTVYLYRSFAFFRLCLRVSINLHDKLFRGITRARMIFFNNNPSGRILNRFARDINNVDSLLPMVLVDVIDVSMSIKELLERKSNMIFLQGCQ